MPEETIEVGDRVRLKGNIETVAWMTVTRKVEAPEGAGTFVQTAFPTPQSGAVQVLNDIAIGALTKEPPPAAKVTAPAKRKRAR